MKTSIAIALILTFSELAWAKNIFESKVANEIDVCAKGDQTLEVTWKIKYNEAIKISSKKLFLYGISDPHYVLDEINNEISIKLEKNKIHEFNEKIIFPRMRVNYFSSLGEQPLYERQFLKPNGEILYIYAKPRLDTEKAYIGCD